MSTENNIPWIEKYRPSKFNDIVLDPINRRIFENIIQRSYFPNLLFYGPPGTGKTTTIINLINEYQTHTASAIDKSMVIHLNASDERGIDIIRNQINHFVKSMNLFKTGIKFVILDEVDYMTKNAQQALKYLLQSSIPNVRFCLICNYITKIDESLKNEFICIRFNQLPRCDIHRFITSICKYENISIKESDVDIIQELYQSDIRSMINFIQLNQCRIDGSIYSNTVSSTTNIMNKCIINTDVFKEIYSMLVISNDIPRIMEYIHNISIQYNTDKKSILKKYLKYMITNPDKSPEISKNINKYIDIAETIFHSTDLNIETILKYFCIHMRLIITIHSLL